MANFDKEPDDLRKTLEASVEKQEEADAALETGDNGEPLIKEVVETPPESKDPPAGDLTPAAPAPAAPSPAPVPASGTPAAPSPAPTPAVGAPPAAPVADGTDKAPGTWSPEAREEWASASPRLREEVWKRERETSRAMTQSTNARRFEQEFGQMVQPFLGFIAAERSTPLAAAQNMMQTAATLRVGTDQQKVAIVADIIKNFKVDLTALDSVLAGTTPEFNPQVQTMQMIDQRLNAFQQNWAQAQQQQTSQGVQQQATTEIEGFAADPKNEFFSDVKNVMGDLIALASQRGENLGLREAYDRAILVHEPVRRVIEQRAAKEKAVGTNQHAARARAASGGVIPSKQVATHDGTAPKDDSIRSALEFAITQQQGR